MKPTQKQIKAAETLFLAKAHVATVRPIIEGIQASVLSRNNFRFEDEEKRIDYVKNREDIYLIKTPDFHVFDKECHTEYLSAGFTVEFGYCPLLIAEDLERQANRALIEAMEPVTNISLEMAMRNYKLYPKFIELALSYLAPFCSSSKQLLASI